jgi:transcriptional regulator with XRE-family HTH domain
MRSLIKSNYKGTQESYANRVGIQPAHLSAFLSGNKSFSLDLLARLLTGIDYTISCEVTITLHPSETGQHAQNVDYTPLEETLSPEDQLLYRGMG